MSKSARSVLTYLTSPAKILPKIIQREGERPIAPPPKYATDKNSSDGAINNRLEDVEDGRKGAGRGVRASSSDLAETIYDRLQEVHVFQVTGAPGFSAVP